MATNKIFRQGVKFGATAINKSTIYSVEIDDGLSIQSTGSNKRLVDATLVSGVVTVSNTSVTANTRFFPTYQTVSGTTGILGKTAQVNGTSFTITSQVAGATNTADNSTITIILIETY